MIKNNGIRSIVPHGNTCREKVLISVEIFSKVGGVVFIDGIEAQRPVSVAAPGWVVVGNIPAGDPIPVIGQLIGGEPGVRNDGHADAVFSAERVGKKG